MILFLSAPYRGEDGLGTAENIKRASGLAKELWWDYDVICPQMNSAWFDYDSDVPPERYLEGYLNMVKVSDVVYFAKGWEESEGCRKEHELALKLGKEVKYER